MKKRQKNFLDVIQDMSIGHNISILKAINQTIQDRLFWLEMREPESDGSVYDSWEEKYDEWNEIAEKSEEILSSVDNDGYDLDGNILELKEMITDFQILYGGLSRLKIDEEHLENIHPDALLL